MQSCCCTHNCKCQTDEKHLIDPSDLDSADDLTEALITILVLSELPPTKTSSCFADALARWGEVSVGTMIEQYNAAWQERAG